MAVDTDVLIVGAGPIGLVNAWALKHLNPDLNVVVLEKYAEYQRSHTLIMTSDEIEELIKVIQLQDDPTLTALVKQLRKDPNIRTNTIQELFTKLAKDSGVDIFTENELTADTIKTRISEEFPNIRLIIGADGTHSTVSQSLFPAGNQIKHEFDHILQLRYDIKESEKSESISKRKLYELMTRKGLFAREYIGHNEDGKTPVTLQMIISKQDYLALKDIATSKKPLKPFTNRGTGVDLECTESQLPPQIQSFLSEYLKYKIQNALREGQTLDYDSVRISVNETPATHAQKIVTSFNNARVILKGDAALGLSYFIGLKAGLKATAMFYSKMKTVVQDGFKDQKALDTQLGAYQEWFLKDFAPKKVKEVERYSFWNIRPLMKAMKSIRAFKNVSHQDSDDHLFQFMEDYVRYIATDTLTPNADKAWRPFPHREYAPVKFGQLEYTPLAHTAKKIRKLFVDYSKPYKSYSQIVADFKQPFTGIGCVNIGLFKLLSGIFILKPKLLVDGLFHMLRGIIEIITTPLAWILKPLTRSIATKIHGGYKKIEENSGMHRLAQKGWAYLADPETNLESPRTIYNLLAVCNDIHRKFNKAQSHGQKTELKVSEYAFYSAIRKDTVLNPQKLHRYFSLFASNKANSVKPGTEEAVSASPSTR